MVVLIHGYAEHCGRYAHLATHLNHHGFAVFTYDQRGHGRSSGRRAFVRSFNRYLDDFGVMLKLARGDFSNVPVFLFGHSMGGAVAALYVLEREATFRGLVLSSPALKVSSDIAPFLQKISSLVGRLLPRLPTIPLDRSLISRDPAVVRQALQDPLNFHGRMPARTGAELLRATRRIERNMDNLTLPFLIIHGTGDRLTDPGGSTTLYQRARSEDKTLGLHPGLYHETFNEPEKAQVLEEIVAWLEEHL
ncbi:MAG: alpha/beta hydrolase [Rhodothermales bacterium]